MNKRYRLLAVVLAFGGIAAACSSEYTRADLIEELTEGDDGFTEEQANCTADGIEEAGLTYEEVDVPADEIDAETQSLLTDIIFDCVLAG